MGHLAPLIAPFCVQCLPPCLPLLIPCLPLPAPQPKFLLKTAPVSAEAAGFLSHAALADLSRTIARPTSDLAESASMHTLSAPPPPAPTAVTVAPIRSGALQLVKAKQVGAGFLGGAALIEPLKHPSNRKVHLDQ